MEAGSAHEHRAGDRDRRAAVPAGARRHRGRRPRPRARRRAAARRLAGDAAVARRRRALLLAPAPGAAGHLLAGQRGGGGGGRAPRGRSTPRATGSCRSTASCRRCCARATRWRARCATSPGDPAGNLMAPGVNVLPYQISLAAQVPHAVGLAWGLRHQGSDGVVCVYFGDGASSEGDTHEALNLAGVRRAPVVFLLKNNGWAISTPVRKQTAATSFAARAAGYGMAGELVDGNDLLAVHDACTRAVARARAGDGPTLIEARTYRMGPHNTSDDPEPLRRPRRARGAPRRRPGRAPAAPPDGARPRRRGLRARADRAPEGGGRRRGRRGRGRAGARARGDVRPRLRRAARALAAPARRARRGSRA